MSSHAQPKCGHGRADGERGVGHPAGNDEPRSLLAWPRRSISPRDTRCAETIRSSTPPIGSPVSMCERSIPSADHCLEIRQDLIAAHDRDG